MSCSIGTNPSFVWRSFMWSRPLLQKGLAWRVGDGSRIATIGEKWVFGKVAQLSSHLLLNDHNTVSCLIEHGKWNEHLVRQLFMPPQVDEVLSIPLFSSQATDQRFCIFDPKGNYTVQEGYKAEMGFFEPPTSSSTSHYSKWWKFIWSLSIPSKVRIFWWRVLHHFIPTQVNLRSHHVPVQGFCPLCHFHSDSTNHALFDCPAIISRWKVTEFWPLLKKVKHLDIWDIFIWLYDKLSVQEFEVFAMGTWAIWNDRLQFLHANDHRALSRGLEKSSDLLREFQSARMALQIVPRSSICVPPNSWSAPPTDHLRLDVDAAYNDSTKSYYWWGD
ncbi:uncharacterized protein [Henckelia pumila]|uniref:uncharacterized protein n=1 Tax=Henckelia pumila TaxID=405737 RepID=UPI003C6DF60D